MHVTRIGDAVPYATTGHFDMVGLRLHGHDTSPSKFAWVGLSHFLPGGGVDRSASMIEKIYVVLTGEISVTTDKGDAVLGPMDSCYLGEGEARAIRNRSNSTASMLVLMPYPETPACLELAVNGTESESND